MSCRYSKLPHQPCICSGLERRKIAEKKLVLRTASASSDYFCEHRPQILRPHNDPKSDSTYEPAKERAPIIRSKPPETPYCKPLETDAEALEESGGNREESNYGDL